MTEESELKSKRRSSRILMKRSPAVQLSDSDHQWKRPCKMDSACATTSSTYGNLNGACEASVLSIRSKEEVSSPSNLAMCCLPAPLSHEPIAVAINEACDYSIRITMQQAKSGNVPRLVRVYADGVYDLFHSGHARQLLQAKAAFPNVYLIVGVCSDASVHRYKGRTVMNEKERYDAIRHCRYVDEVLTDAPWQLSDEFLKKHKIDFVAHDDIPYASSSCNDVYKPLKDAGMFLVTQRTEGISTTDVIGRIVRGYDLYLRRNIKRGLSRKELNISYVKEKSLRVQDNLEAIVKRGASIIQVIDSKRREFVDQLEDMSHEMIRSFMRIFGSDGRLRTWWSKHRPLTGSHSTSESWNDGDHSQALSLFLPSSDEEAEDTTRSKAGDEPSRYLFDHKPPLLNSSCGGGDLVAAAENIPSHATVKAYSQNLVRRRSTTLMTNA